MLNSSQTKQPLIRNNVNHFAFFYRLLDFAVIQLSLYAAAWFYDGRYNIDFFILALIANISYSFFAELFWLYRSWRNSALKEILFNTATSWMVTLFPVMLFIFFSKTAEEYSRMTLGLWFVAGLYLLCSWRILMRYWLYWVRKSGRNTRRVGIIGLTDNAGCHLAEEILNAPEIGYRLTGIFDERSTDRLNQKYANLFRGNIDDGVRLAQLGEFDVLFIALPMSAKDRIDRILRRLGDTTVNVHLIPDFFVYNLLHARMGQVGNIQTVSVYDTPMRGGWSLLKRLEDLVLASIALLILGLPMLAIAAGVKLTSRGPVIFKQDRYGLDGRKFKVWKFRTMTATENGDVVTQAKRGDARITPFGGFLRRTSLDELPQFINVLQGTMSVVGPRPHAVAHNEGFRKQVDFYMLRHKMKPGITGWAQVNGWRGETDTIDKIRMRTEYDLEYIRNWSLWMDFKIILATMTKGFIHKNAY